MGVFSRTRPGDIPDKDKEVLDSVMNQLYNAIRVMVEDTESNILDSAGKLTPSNLIRFMEYIYGLVDDRSYSINSRIADYVNTIVLTLILLEVVVAVTTELVMCVIWLVKCLG